MLKYRFHYDLLIEIYKKKQIFFLTNLACAEELVFDTKNIKLQNLQCLTAKAP